MILATHFERTTTITANAAANVVPPLRAQPGELARLAQEPASAE